MYLVLLQTTDHTSWAFVTLMRCITCHDSHVESDWIISRIWDSTSSGYEKSCILGYNAVQFVWKSRLSFNELHGVMSQNTELLRHVITVPVRIRRNIVQRLCHYFCYFAECRQRFWNYRYCILISKQVMHILHFSINVDYQLFRPHPAISLVTVVGL
jgi:hypothetical protein